MEKLFNWFTNDLPPLLQLMVGMFIALATFKLLTAGVDLIKGNKDKKKED